MIENYKDPIRELTEHTASMHNTDCYQLTRAFLDIDDVLTDYFDIPEELVFELLGLLADLRGIKGEEAGIAFNSISHRLVCDFREKHIMPTEAEFKERFIACIPAYFRRRIFTQLIEVG